MKPPLTTVKAAKVHKICKYTQENLNKIKLRQWNVHILHLP